jgi:ribA/ribD-fused uncharacterized protein
MTGEAALHMTKAVMNNDRSSFNKMTKETDPKTIKALGKQVKPFDKGQWSRERPGIAFWITKQKFENNSKLENMLLRTNGKYWQKPTRKIRFGA